MELDQARGILLGLACGDALGRPVEFKSAEQITAQYGTLSEMVGNGTWGKPAGTVTDDTDQALCIAESLVKCGEFDPEDIADRFVAWYDSNPFDIGNMTRRSIRALKQGKPWGEAGRDVWKESSEGANAGNGSVMRCPPLALAYPDNPDRLVQTSRESSFITHADERCTYGCAVLNLTIAGLLREDDEPLGSALETVRSDAPEELLSALEPVARGEELEQLSTSGYVIHSLQTALHDGLRAESGEDALVTAVNRGGDTDTIGAIAGAVAGARFGASGLPESWIETVDGGDEIRRLATRMQHLNLE